jgi:hypothetical protein
MTATEVPLRDGPRHASLLSVRPMMVVISLLVALALPAVGASARGGDDDRDEVRVAGTCGGGARSELELKARDGVIEAEFEVDHARRGSLWRLTLSQEGRVVWRGSLRARSGSLEVERRLRNLAGADRVSVRASGPRGVTCRATATLAGD